MSPSLEFHPLRLGRADGGYRGYGGVCDWFEQLMADGRHHTIEISEFRTAGRNRMIALGEMRLESGCTPKVFWALYPFSDGLIAAAHHYLTDADIQEHGRLSDS